MLAQDDHLPELYGKLLDRFAHLVAGVSTRENGRSGNSGQLDRSAIAIEAERDLPQWLIASSEDRSDLPRGVTVYTTRGRCRGRQYVRQFPLPATRAGGETTFLV